MKVNMVNTAYFNLLVVDDDLLIHQALKAAVPTCWKTFHASSLAEVPKGQIFHAALVDMHLELRNPEPLGVRVVASLTQNNPQCEVVAMSGDLDRELMERCLRAGAQRYLAKPLQFEELKLVLDKIEALWRMRSFDVRSSHSADLRWVGSSPASQEIKKKIASLRGETKTILIEGETGAGKEVVAKLLHAQESERPLVSINIAAIPESLFESEVFGHVKGAFTGADQNKLGLVEAAHGGDLFLDEVEAMSQAQQVKLLRFLESGEFRRVGAKENSHVRVRVIVASNVPLRRLVDEGRFREDLYFRLTSQRIEIPPLRNRLSDISELCLHFLAQERPRRNKTIAEDALAALQNYSWPGNVRELRRIIEQMSLTSPLPLIRADDVQRILGHSTQAGPNSSAIELSKGLNKLVEEFEASVISEVMQKTDNIDEAALILKISRSNLYKKLKDYQLGEDKN